MAQKILGQKSTRIRLSWRGFLALALFLFPFWMLLLWHFTPNRELLIAIIDKTVVAQPGQEHLSLHWVLNQEKFSKNKTELYDPNQDYFGFFPLEKEQYKLKGLERFNIAQLNDLSNRADATYITDAYGVFRNEWFKVGNDQDRSGIVYGGMSRQDLFLLQKMKEKKKLIITEFNSIGSPTDTAIRQQFEQLFDITWSGWIGRYFESFDTTVNKELPPWLIRNYKRTHNDKWPFKNSGIALIHAANDQVVILENKTHLDNELPFIYTNTEGKDHYGMPDKIKYSFWFDIISVNNKTNDVLSEFVIDVNEAGARELAKFNIPARFPAITSHVDDDYRFFYFSADFCDNPVTLTSSYFKGVGYFKWMMYTRRDALERKSFFWKLYRPLLTTILNDYYDSLQ
ncbi:hypothetical protein [Sediminibacterium sp.]|uniref:hypothetical protein n=1 Tax=Sediminibacterium sp. TaxID=1917865 RepID=UPI0025FAFD13|nr:hypothetical protein [Sediminibacterium sp.]MBW0176958.1 hypothetical protein [Sediminibacterium sp.]